MFLLTAILRPEKGKSAMNKPTRKHTGRNISRRNASRNSHSRKAKQLSDDDFYKHASEVDRMLELEFADDDPEGIRLAHK
jgi:hypothetical protein